MTLDSLPDLDTSGLCLVKTISTALTCWPYRNMALRDGARTSTRTSSVAKRRTASIPCRPASPRQTEALSSRTSRSRPLETSQPSGARAKNEHSESDTIERRAASENPLRATTINDFAKLGTADHGEARYPRHGGPGPLRHPPWSHPPVVRSHSNTGDGRVGSPP